MARIEIREKNLESVSTSSDVTDIVYIPGFGDPNADGADEVIVGVPTFVSTVYTFKRLFGKSARPLSNSYSGSNFNTPSGITAPDISGNDPAWGYALKILQAGIPIYYERINENEDTCTAELMYNKFYSSSETSTLISQSETFTGSQMDTSHKKATLSYKAESITKVTFYKVTEEGTTETEIPSTGYSYSYTTSTGKSILTITDSSITITHEDSLKIEYKRKYTSEESIFDKLNDRGTYRIKYITTGGYPIYEHKNFGKIKEHLIDAVATMNAIEAGEDATTARGDCIVFIDHTNIPSRPLTGSTSVYGLLNADTTETYNAPFSKDVGTYFTMMTPWCKDTDGVDVPASLLYLQRLGAAIKLGNYWGSIAGVSRGCVETLISKVNTNTPITATIANTYQSENVGDININAITEVYPYGQCIMGIRTLEPIPAGDNQSGTGQLTANNIINLRCAISDIKKAVYRTAKSLLFEQNSSVIWVKFKNGVTPTLDAMVAASIIESYQLVQSKENDYGQDYDMKRTLKASISIVPTYPVEQFIVNIDITDSEVTVD